MNYQKHGNYRAKCSQKTLLIIQPIITNDWDDQDSKSTTLIDNENYACVLQVNLERGA